MTDKEIMYANPLEWKLMVAKNTGNTKVTYDELNGLVETIKSQQAEISEYKDKCEKCGEKTRVCIESLQNNIAEKQAEIERLKNRNIELFGERNREHIKLKTAKSEAIEEFAERLKAKEAVHFCKCGEPFVYTDLFNGEVDNLVKEMAGEDK